MKAFYAGTVIPPTEWMEVAGAPSHVRQGDVLAFAESKADLRELLLEVGAPAWSAENITTAARWSKDFPYGQGWSSVMDLGVIDPERRSVYCVGMHLVRGSVVIEVTAAGLVPVARMEYDSGYKGRGLYAVAVS